MKSPPRQIMYVFSSGDNVIFLREKLHVTSLRVNCGEPLVFLLLSLSLFLLPFSFQVNYLSRGHSELTGPAGPYYLHYKYGSILMFNHQRDFSDYISYINFQVGVGGA